MAFLEGLATFVPTVNNKRTYEAFKVQSHGAYTTEDTMNYNQ